MAKPRAKSRKESIAPSLSTQPSLITKFIPLLLAIAGIIAYLNSLHAPFIFDDRYHIVENARIRELWPPWPYLLHTSRPIVYLTLAINYAFGGLNPIGYHVLNLAIHILAALVLYGVLRRTRVGDWLAAVIAAVWLVHPLQTEAVTYVIQRAESLMGLFYLLTLYCAIRAAASSNKTAWWCGATASCFLGMATKGGIMITAPLLVLLYDRVFLTRSWAGVFRQRWVLYAALAATWICYPFMLATAPEEWKTSAGFEYGASPLQYALTQPKVILHYLRLAFWPDQLCLDYGWPITASVADALPYLLIIGALIALIVWAWRRKPELAFLGTSFFLILVPTSSFIPIADVAVEHRMYLSLAPLVALAFLALRYLGRDRLGAVPLIAGGLAIALLTAVTIDRNSDYASKISIWEDAVKKSPANPRGQYDLGVALEDEGKMDAALAHYQQAIQLNPKYTDALTNLGHALLVSGRPSESVPYLQKALEIKPDIPEAHNSLGLALAQQGNSLAAVSHWEQALKLKPNYAEPHNNLGIVLAQQGRTNDAIAQWQEALKTDPNLVDAHNNLAYALSQLGRSREAIQHYDEALRLNPAYFQAQINLAKLLVAIPPAQGGDPARAVALAQHACDAGHHDAPCLDTVAGIYAAAGNRDEAIKIAQSALDLARSTGQSSLAAQIESNLHRYR